MAEENKNPLVNSAGPVPGDTATLNPNTTSKKVKEEETVEVPKATLDRILKRLDDNDKELDILRESADKGRYERISSLRNEGKLVKSVRLNTIGGKIIVGWATVRDDVYLDEQGRLHEDQIIKVIFEDKSDSEIEYRNFTRNRTQLVGEVIQEAKDRDGNTNLKVELPDGRTFEMDVRFVN